ncbi:hypothetical protein CQW39_10220 [Streptomyces griseofuscus]|uniref:Uncharacterized protein n=1 Tax=Streptomyces griseofuscus TaxID=146922 RepID=A0A3R8WSQ0_9ACTN|nr:hypothetical protein [Streptomyces griseofuscus]RRQ79495.1 hypothetical protein CQW39_10220 [Streptomyces griseofuscus]RRQ85062.1 hypothetical protein CQW44_18910 [Streptomyces griseofuscus]
MSGPRSRHEEPGAQDSTGELIRWAAFTCVLVPVVLLWYGTSLAGATGTALGLAAVTSACRLLLRRSERAARHGARRGAGGRRGRGSRRAGTRAAGRDGGRGEGRNGTRGGGRCGVQRGGRHTRERTPVD